MIERIRDFGRGRAFAAACNLYPKSLSVEEKREKAMHLELLLIDVGESITLSFKGGQARVDCLPFDSEGEKGYLRIEVNLAEVSAEGGSVSVYLAPDSGARARIGEVVVDPCYIGKRPKIDGSLISFEDAAKQ